MARIKLSIPEKLLFKTIIKVRITDINYGNHLGNDALVGILHEARVQWLNSLSYTELDIDGIGLIMSDLAVEYKSESFAGDELIIRIYLGERSNVSFDLYYVVELQPSKLVALGKTGMVCFNYKEKKVVHIPAALNEMLNS